MKKIILILSVIGWFTGFVYSQDQTNKPTQIGIIGGLNLTNLNTSDAVSNINAGFNAGGFVRFPVTNYFAIEPELYVSTKGSSMTYNSLSVNGTAKFNLTYLEMPLIAVFNMTKLVNLQVGPYVSYLIDGTVKNVANVTLFNFEQNLNVNDYNRLDFNTIWNIYRWKILQNITKLKNYVTTFNYMLQGFGFYSYRLYKYSRVYFKDLTCSKLNLWGCIWKSYT